MEVRLGGNHNFFQSPRRNFIKLPEIKPEYISLILSMFGISDHRCRIHLVLMTKANSERCFGKNIKKGISHKIDTAKTFEFQDKSQFKFVKKDRIVTLQNAKK